MFGIFRRHTPEMKEILRLAYPIILGQLGVVAMGVADTIMVGKLGTEAMASVNQANNLFFMFSGLTFGMLFSVSTLVSIKVGEKKSHEAYIIYRSSLIVSIILFLFQFTAITILVNNFHWMGQKGNMNVLVPDFLRIIGWSVLPLLITMSSRQLTDGLGHTKVFMILTLGGLGLNILLNWVLIYGNCGFEPMGINGAAYATLISRIVIAVVGLWYVRYSKLMRQYLPSRMPSYKEAWRNMSEIWKMGTPMALQTFAEWACFSLSGIMVGWYGSVQLAAHAVALNVASVTYMIASGLAIAGSILTGNGYGERNLTRIRKIGIATFILIGLFELMNAVAFIAFNKQIASVYQVENEVMPYILPLLTLAAFFQLSDGIQAAAMSLLRGIKDVVWAGIIAVLSYWVVSIPLSYFSGQYRFIWNGHKFVKQISAGAWFENAEVYGIWVGFTVGLLVAALFGTLRFFYKLKRLNFDEIEK